MPSYSQFANIPSVSVAPATFTPGVFKPTEFRVDEPNWGLAHQAINEHNRIVETVAANQDAIQATINQLDINDADREYLNDYAKNIQDRINDKLNSGDWRGAMRESIASARSAATDRSLLTRVKRNTDQKNEQDEILKSKEYSDLTKRRWVKENGYGSGLVVNDDNTVNSWSANWRPVADIGIETLASYAAKFVAEKTSDNASSSSGPTSKSLSGVDLTDPNAIINTGGHSHFTRRYKTKEDIKAVLDEFALTNPDYWRALQQQYDNYKFVIDEYEKAKLSGQPLDQMMELEYNTAKKYMDKVAGVCDVHDFVWKLIGGTVERMAYDNRSSDVGSNTAFVGGNKSNSNAGLDSEVREDLLTGRGSVVGGQIRGYASNSNGFDITSNNVWGQYTSKNTNTNSNASKTTKSYMDGFYNGTK